MQQAQTDAGASPFLDLVSPAEGRVWRPLVILAGGLTLGMLISTLGLGATLGAFRGISSADEASLRDQALSLLRTAIPIAGLALGIVLVAALTHRRRVMSFITSAPHFRWSLFLAGVIASGLLHSLTAAALGLSDPPLSEPGLGDEKAFFAAASVLAFIAIAAAEEAVFRGWLTQQVGAYTRRAVVIVLVTSAVFALLHLRLDLLLLARFASGVAYAWAVLRLGGLEFGIGAHLAKNVAFTWLGAAGDQAALGALASFIPAALLVVGVELWVRRHGRRDRPHPSTSSG